jgi:GT2 family glycosyltransferase
MLELLPLSSAQVASANVGVIMTAHNRRESTLRCIQSIIDQQVATATKLVIVVVDDGSSDGTADALHERFPNVEVVKGTGDLYWGGGMRIAHFRLLESVRPDHLLWVNDDVVLTPDALSVLLTVAAERPGAIVVGPLCDPDSKETTYSGFRRAGRSPLGLVLQEPSPSGAPTDTFNGNVVLLPETVYAKLGPVDAAFPHKYGDLDYGYRAAARGVPVVIAPAHVGTCPRNVSHGTWQDPTQSLTRRLSDLHSPKVKPFRPYMTFIRRHGGPEWPLRIPGGYIKAYWAIFRSRAQC